MITTDVAPYLQTFCENVPSLSLIEFDLSPAGEVLEILQRAESLCNWPDGVCPAPWGLEEKVAKPRVIRMFDALELDRYEVIAWTAFAAMAVTAALLKLSESARNS